MKHSVKLIRENNTYGITLIALVITIIVLLILAGVSIATLTGPNGLLTRANDAKTEMGKAGAKEKVQVEVAGSYDNSGNLSKDMLNKNLENVEGLTSGTPITGFPATVVVDGYEVTIDGNGKVTVEGEITNPPTPPSGSTSIEDARKDEMLDKTENTKVEDAEGEEFTVPEGFKVTEDADKVTDGIVIEDKLGNQFVWIPVKSESEYVRNTSYANTNVSPKSYTDKGYLPEGIQPDLAGATTDAQIGEKNEQAEREAVVNAGGFYISRYEAGKEGKDKLLSKKRATVWVDIAQEDMKTTTKTMYNTAHVKSALCSGIQWDMVMKFVDGKNDGTGKVFDVGTYSDTRHTETLKTSGQIEADRVSNIYDLEGNCYEYVAEKNTYSSGGSYINRGGSYYSNSFPASQRSNSSGNTYSSVSFRLVLYIM